MTVPKGFRAKPIHCSGPDSMVVFSFFPVFYFSAWPGKDNPSSHIFTCLGASHFKSVCHAPLNRSRKLTPFSEHSPWVSRFSENDSSWSALEKTLREKEHYKSRRIQDQGPGMEPVSSDMTSLGFLFFWWYDSFGGFLAVFIHFFFYPFNKEHLRCIRRFYARHLQESNGNHGNVIMETCLSKWNQHVPGPQIRGRQEMSVSIGLFLSLPIQSPNTFYQVRQPLCTQHPPSALSFCF